MSLTAIIAILAILATLAAAFLQPIVVHWLTPRQKLRVDIICSRYVIPPVISREMSEYCIQLRVQNATPKPEFGDFLRNAERFQSFFEVTVTNTGKTISRNVFLGCSAYGKYVIVQSRNRYEYRSDEPEYLLGDIQPSEQIRCQIWSPSSIPSYEVTAAEMFSVRDDHNSSKEIVLRRFYDRASYYLLNRDSVRDFVSMLKWTFLPPLLLGLIIYVGVAIFRHFWSSQG